MGFSTTFCKLKPLLFLCVCLLSVACIQAQLAIAPCADPNKYTVTVRSVVASPTQFVPGGSTVFTFNAFTRRLLGAGKGQQRVFVDARVLSETVRGSGIWRQERHLNVPLCSLRKCPVNKNSLFSFKINLTMPRSLLDALLGSRLVLEMKLANLNGATFTCVKADLN